MKIESGKIHTSELHKTLLCAQWLVGQFEELDHPVIANIFSKALSDAESWIKLHSKKNPLLIDCETNITLKEAEKVRRFLVKYAAIQNPNIRDRVLDEISSLATLKGSE